MKSLKDKIIIGIDHGYGNIKTANHCFKTGITTHDSEPLFTKDMLIYNSKYSINAKLQASANIKKSYSNDSEGQGKEYRSVGI